MKRFLKSFAITSVLALLVICNIASFAAYENPQKYSTDSYTSEQEFQAEIDAVSIPKYAEQKNISVWLNKSEISVSPDAEYKNGTVYVPFVDFFTKAGYEASISGKNLSLSGENLTVSATVGGKKVNVNGESKTLTCKIKKISGEVMVPADFMEVALDAKVWYDKAGKTYAITTGSMKDDEILRIINGKLYMNGQPYYEISFNKWDLAYQISSSISSEAEWSAEENQLSAAEEALQMLHDNGFKTIRVFVSSNLRGAYFRSQKQKDKFYQAMDLMFDTLDKYDIKIVCSMGLTSGHFVDKNESICDLYCVEDSQSRKNLYQYIDEFVTRYKDRKSVLMWEIENEGNLQLDIGWTTRNVQVSARHLGKFYTDVANRIRQNDPERLVTGGDGEFRGAQFNLYKGTRLGMVGSNWTQDTLEERLIALQIVYAGIDVVSVHSYDYGLNEIYYAQSRENTETTRHQDLFLYMDECKTLGKVLYNGETSLSCTAGGYDDSNFTKEEVDEYLQGTIDAGVQLTHWWTFHCDRQGHDAEDTYTWDMTFGKGLEAVKDANAKLKAKYVVNGISSAGDASGCKSVMGSSAMVIMMLSMAVVALKKKK